MYGKIEESKEDDMSNLKLIFFVAFWQTAAQKEICLTKNITAVYNVASMLNTIFISVPSVANWN